MYSILKNLIYVFHDKTHLYCSGIIACVPNLLFKLLSNVHLVNISLIICTAQFTRLKLKMCLTPRINDKQIWNIPDVSKLDLDNDHCDYIEVENLSNLNCIKYDMRLLHLNCRGLISKQSEVSKLLNSFGPHKPNVMLLNETWLCQDTECRIKIPG